MASVGVVHKLNVLQQTNNNNNERREIIILRKTPHHILPQPKDASNTVRKKQSQKAIKESTSRTTPQPMAVARRNARERNRVKQVNNGFANLRQHIPNFIASAFESNSRGGSKKLSKVETLRMAVEYIRSLEDVLSLDEEGRGTNASHTPIFSSPGSSTTQPYQGDEDDLSTNPTPPPYTYQIIPYDDSENLEPINVEQHILSDPSLMSGDLEFRGAQDLSMLNAMHVSDSLSPGIYTDQSLSPDQGDFGAIVVKSEDMSIDIPVISLKNEHELPNQHKTDVIDVMQWWEQQQSPHT